MANPKLKPLFGGTPATRKSAADKRLKKAVRDAPNRKGTAGRRSATGDIAVARERRRTTRAAGVRNSVDPLRRNVFNNDWIKHRAGRFPQRWHYWHGKRPVDWWWRPARWAALTTWISYDWSDPYYYDYGDTVYYEDDAVFVDGEAVSSYDDYVDSAQELAGEEDPPADAEIEWEPLGTWAISTDASTTDSRMMLQLVLSKDGHVSGTYYNTQTDNTQRVHGSLDEASQRLAFTIGKSTKTVLEVGLDNLTKNEAPMWVHFTAKDTTQTWLLVRLESPEPVPDEGS
jgi:hypothetical protein